MTLGCMYVGRSVEKNIYMSMDPPPTVQQQQHTTTVVEYSVVLQYLILYILLPYTTSQRRASCDDVYADGRRPRFGLSRVTCRVWCAVNCEVWQGMPARPCLRTCTNRFVRTFSVGTPRNSCNDKKHQYSCPQHRQQVR